MLFEHRIRVALFLLSIWLIQISDGFSQIQRVPITSFSSRSLSAPFHELLPNTDASLAFWDSGIIFGDANSTPRIIRRPFPPPQSQTVESLLQNLPNVGSSSEKPMWIRLTQGARRVAMRIVDGQFLPKAEALLSFWTPTGRLLGEEEVDLDNEGPISIQTSDEEGIGLISIDFQENPVPEELSRFQVDFLEAPTNRLVSAQVAALSSATRRLVSVVNVVTAGREATLRFRSPSGEPLTLSVDGQLTDSLPVPALTQRSVRIESPPGQGAVQGHVVLESDHIIAAELNVEMLIEEVKESPTPSAFQERHRFIIPGRFPQVYHAFHVRKEESSGLNTGVALVNVSTQEVDVEVGFDRVGTFGIEQPIIFPARFQIGPGAQFTFLVDQFCTLFSTADGGPVCRKENSSGHSPLRKFSSQFFVRAELPISVVVIETRNGWPASAAPIRRFSHSPATSHTGN